MFGPVIGVICFAWSPIESELFLALAVAKPMESHVHCFGAFWLDFAVDDGVRHRVVSLDGGGRLFVAQLLENYSYVDGFTCHDIEGGKFGFGGGRHDMFDDVCDVEDGAIVGGGVCIV